MSGHQTEPCDLLVARVWNGLDQSAGFIIQSSPGGFGLDWIRNLPTLRILNWTGSINSYPIFRDLRQFLLIITLMSEVLPSNLQLPTLVCSYMQILQGVWQIPSLLCLDFTGLDSVSGSSAGLDWITINGSWIWTGLDLINSIHFILCWSQLRSAVCM